MSARVYRVIYEVGDRCLELIIVPDGIHEPRCRGEMDGPYNVRVQSEILQKTNPLPAAWPFDILSYREMYLTPSPQPERANRCANLTGTPDLCHLRARSQAPA
jgi:hypothetical protein